MDIDTVSTLTRWRNVYEISDFIFQDGQPNIQFVSPLNLSSLAGGDNYDLELLEVGMYILAVINTLQAAVLIIYLTAIANWVEVEHPAFALLFQVIYYLMVLTMSKYSEVDFCRKS